MNQLKQIILTSINILIFRCLLKAKLSFHKFHYLANEITARKECHTFSNYSSKIILAYMTDYMMHIMPIRWRPQCWQFVTVFLFATWLSFFFFNQCNSTYQASFKANFTISRKHQQSSKLNSFKVTYWLQGTHQRGTCCHSNAAHLVNVKQTTTRLLQMSPSSGNINNRKAIRLKLHCSVWCCYDNNPCLCAN